MKYAGRKRILLIDDSPTRRELIARVLSRSHYAVRATDTAEDGLNLLVRHAFDLVLMDIILPGVSGIEACRRIVAKNRTRSVPIILLSAIKVSSASQAEGLEAGAIGYLEWPVSARELKARVSAALGTNLPQAAEEIPELSPRQLEVTAWIAEGLTTKEVAEKLQISVRTAETHRAAILRRLGFRSTAHLVGYAIERRITPESLRLR